MRKSENLTGKRQLKDNFKINRIYQKEKKVSYKSPQILNFEPFRLKIYLK